MKKFALILVAVFLVACAFPVMAENTDAIENTNIAEDTIEWDPIVEIDFEEGIAAGDFYSYFNTYDIDDTNIGVEEDNTFYVGQFPKGLKINYLWDLEEFKLNFDFKGAGTDVEVQNAYKSAVILQHSITGMNFVNEPDNGDEDKTSFMGMSGVGVYMWGSTLEIVVTSNKDGGTAGPANGVGLTGVVDKAADRHFGVYGVSYQFTLPEEKTFDEFRNVDITLKNGIITILVDEALICTVELSQVEAVTTILHENHWNKDLVGLELIDSEEVYRKAVIKDNQGQEVLTVDGAVVMKCGAFVFTNRVAPFGLDNIVVYEEHVDVPVVTQAPATPTPDPTQVPATEVPSTDVPKAEEKGGCGSSSAIAQVMLVLGAALIIKKKK